MIFEDMHRQCRIGSNRGESVNLLHLNLQGSFHRLAV